MPARIDPGLRGRLVDELVGRIGDAETATIRSLATAVGTSTMTIYSQFGGMPGLWSAAREEGFRRLAAALAGLPDRNDPVEQVMALASAYVTNAVAHPGLYLTMFDARHDLADLRVADASFARLVAAAERARQTGRFRADLDGRTTATRLWSVAHGLLMLTLTGVLPPTALAEHLPAMSHALFVGFGDEPDTALDSITAGWTPPPATA